MWGRPGGGRGGRGGRGSGRRRGRGGAGGEGAASATAGDLGRRKLAGGQDPLRITGARKPAADQARHSRRGLSVRPQVDGDPGSACAGEETSARTPSVSWSECGGSGPRAAAQASTDQSPGGSPRVKGHHARQARSQPQEGPRPGCFLRRRRLLTPHTSVPVCPQVLATNDAIKRRHPHRKKRSCVMSCLKINF